jgi:hypothetical protein
MAKYGPSSITVEYDNSGGTLVDISQHVLTLNDVDVEELVEEVHSFGDSWEENLPIGVGRMAEIVLGGLYDDASDGPDDLFADRIPEGPAATSRTLKITWGGSKTTSVETFLRLFKRQAARDGITKFETTLVCTGTVTEV